MYFMYIYIQRAVICVERITFYDIFFLVEGDHGEVVLVEAGEAVDEVGAGERVNVGHAKVEGGQPVHGPGAVVAHNLVALRRF